VKVGGQRDTTWSADATASAAVLTSSTAVSVHRPIIAEHRLLTLCRSVSHDTLGERLSTECWFVALVISAVL